MAYKYYNLRGPINEENTEKFILFINDNTENKIFVILNTGGGDYWQAQTIIHMLNNHKDATLFVQAAYSSGMRIFVESKCKKLISKACRGMWHYGKIEVGINYIGKPANMEDVAIMEEMEASRLDSEKFAKAIMTEAEFKKYKKNKDVFF